MERDGAEALAKIRTREQRQREPPAADALAPLLVPSALIIDRRLRRPLHRPPRRPLRPRLCHQLEPPTSLRAMRPSLAARLRVGSADSSRGGRSSSGATRTALHACAPAAPSARFRPRGRVARFVGCQTIPASSSRSFLLGTSVPCLCASRCAATHEPRRKPSGDTNA